MPNRKQIHRRNVFLCDESEGRDSAFWRAAAIARDSEHWGYHEINTNHMIAINRPRELADVLLGISG